VDFKTGTPKIQIQPLRLWDFHLRAPARRRGAAQPDGGPLRARSSSSASSRCVLANRTCCGRGPASRWQSASRLIAPSGFRISPKGSV